MASTKRQMTPVSLPWFCGNSRQFMRLAAAGYPTRPV